MTELFKIHINSQHEEVKASVVDFSAIEITDFSFLIEKIKLLYENNYSKMYDTFESFIKINFTSIIHLLNNSIEDSSSILKIYLKTFKKIVVKPFNTISFEIHLNETMLDLLFNKSEYNNISSKNDRKYLSKGFLNKMDIDSCWISPSSNELIMQFDSSSNIIYISLLSYVYGGSRVMKYKSPSFYLKKFLDEIFPQYCIFLITFSNKFNYNTFNKNISSINQLDKVSLELSPIGINIKFKDYLLNNNKTEKMSMNLDNNPSVLGNTIHETLVNKFESKSDEYKSIIVYFNGLDKRNIKKPVFHRVITVPNWYAFSSIFESYTKNFDLLVIQENKSEDFLERLLVWITTSQIYETCLEVFGDSIILSNNKLDYINTKTKMEIKVELLKLNPHQIISKSNTDYALDSLDNNEKSRKFNQSFCMISSKPDFSINFLNENTILTFSVTNKVNINLILSHLNNNTGTDIESLLELILKFFNYNELENIFELNTDIEMSFSCKLTSLKLFFAELNSLKI